MEAQGVLHNSCRLYNRVCSYTERERKEELVLLLMLYQKCVRKRERKWNGSWLRRGGTLSGVATLCVATAELVEGEGGQTDQ